MGKITITPDQLAKAVSEELGLYHEGVKEKITQATREAITSLVRKTKATAPVKYRGVFKRSIAGDFRGLKTGTNNIKATWYVKSPEHRLTHLVVHGHAKRDGGRTKGNPFLQNALDEVLPAFEEAVKGAVKND